MAPGEALEGFAQVRVRVDLQDPKAGMSLRKLRDETEWARVIAAEDRGDRPPIEDAPRLARDVFGHLLAGRVHLCDRRSMAPVAGHGATGADHRLGRRPRGA